MRVELSKWGNSAGIRIPKRILSEIGANIGDAFEIGVREDGCISLEPLYRAHRKVTAAKGVTASKLFAGYEYERDESDDVAWPDDELVGAEAEVWR